MLFRRRQKDDGSNYIPGFSRSSQLIDLFGGIGVCFLFDQSKFALIISILVLFTFFVRVLQV